MFGREKWPEHLKPVKDTEGMISAKEATALYDFAREVTSGCIVEVGSYRGRSTVALALGAKAGSDVPVYAVDPHEKFTGAKGGEFGPEDRAAFYRAMLDSGCYQQVRLLSISSEVLSQGWRQEVSLLWLDGDHSFQGVRRDFEAWQPHLADGALVIFDDVDDVLGGPNQWSGVLLDGEIVDPVLEVGKIRAVRMRRRAKD